jgi:hypothetical protein
MKKKIFILGSIIAIAILFYPQESISLSTGSPGGKTGSPTDGVDCMQCHGVFSTSTTTSNITSNIPPSGYVPGNIYNITAVHNGAGFGDPTGFEITCEENTSNTKTGIFFITNSTTTQNTNNGSAVTHTTAGNSLSTWSFDWEAPIVGTGDITFYGAFIEAGYPIGANSGDYFSSTTLSASEFPPTNITETSNSHIKEILKITDILGRETKAIKNKPLFYIYNDGTIEKRITIE